MDFDLYALVAPKDDRDIGAILGEALAELRSINAHLEAALRD